MKEGSRGGPTMDLCVTECDGSVLEHLSPGNVLWVGLRSLSSLLCGVSVSFDITEQRHLMSGPLETRHRFSSNTTAILHDTCPIISHPFSFVHSLYFTSCIWSETPKTALMFDPNPTVVWSRAVPSHQTKVHVSPATAPDLISSSLSIHRYYLRRSKDEFVPLSRQLKQTGQEETSPPVPDDAASADAIVSMLSNINNYSIKLMLYFR